MNIAERVAGCVEQVTGYDLAALGSKARHREICDARFIFAHQCRKLGMAVVEIAAALNRTHPSVLHMFDAYVNAYCVDKNFRKLAMQIDALTRITDD